MQKQECVAMILAGGQGSRLGCLTKKIAKPALPFGGKYRIIDFTLSNCTNSGISNVGVLTQYQPLFLNSYIGIGSSWDLDRKGGGVSVLPPYVKESVREWYKGTANAIFQNMHYIDMYAPEYVLVLSGDHIYQMDYSCMIEYHKKKNAQATIAVIEVPWEEAGRFGIMNSDESGVITDFCEKPEFPKSNLASMGIYVFNWKELRKHLESDELDSNSSNDFGKNVIPKMLATGLRVFSYPFQGYWKDVGAIQSLWEANMDLLSAAPKLNLYNPELRIYSVNSAYPPHYIGQEAKIYSSIISDGCVVEGEVEHSVLSSGVTIGRGSKIKDSILLPNVKVGNNVYIDKAIIGEETIINDNSYICWKDEKVTDDLPYEFDPSGITVIGEGIKFSANMKL